MNILVTGASRGIGRAMALAFGREKHHVLVNYQKNRDKAEEVVDLIHQHGGQAQAVAGDVSKPSEARRLVEGVVEKWGVIDGLVNNAGIARDRTVLKMSEEEWRDVIEVNLNGAFWCLQAAAKKMVKQKKGFIVNITSLLGVQGAFGCANYNASKAGLIALTKSAAKELGRFNIRVNAIMPGYHPTDMGASVLKLRTEKRKEEHVLGRFTDQEELAKFVVELSQKESVSGQVFNFDNRII